MGNEFIVSTGKIIKEYLNEYGFSQKDACSRLGISEKHLSNILNGNSRLTEEVALKLEKILPVPASYWLNLEAHYREFIAREQQELSLSEQNLTELSKRFRFAEVFKGLDWSILKQAQEMLKLLKISNYENFNQTYSNLAMNFMEDGGEIESIAIWINLCEEEIEIQNDDLSDIKYSEANLRKSLDLFKKLALNSNVQQSLENCRKLCNRLGVNLVVREAITNSKVRGALTTKFDRPTIYISCRYKTHDHIWFAIMHEIAHLLLHYNSHETIVSNDDDNSSIELEANNYARNFFVPEKDFILFKEKQDFSVSSIISFAKQQNVLPGIIVAFLQHDKTINPNELNKLKNRI